MSAKHDLPDQTLSPPQGFNAFD